MFTRALLLAAASGLCLGLVSAAAGEAAPAKGAAEALARASRVAGTVEFRREGAQAYAALAQDAELFKGDQVRTGRKSSLELKLADDSCITLGEDSALVLREVRGKAKSDRTLLDLDEGQLGAAVEKLGERQRFEISTPVAVCGVRGTRWAMLHLRPEGKDRDKDRGKTTLTVGSGKVNADCLNPLVGGKGGVDVGKGHSLTITWDGFGKEEGVKPAGFKDLMKPLPGWHPDPADPNLASLHSPWPEPQLGRAGGWWNRGAPDGPGAFDRGPSGFSNGAGNAILGSLGLLDTVPGQRSGGGKGSPGGGPAGAPPGLPGNLFNADVGGADPVLPGLVRPGQPTQPPLPPPPPPPPS